MACSIPSQQQRRSTIFVVSFGFVVAHAVVGARFVSSFATLPNTFTRREFTSLPPASRPTKRVPSVRLVSSAEADNVAPDTLSKAGVTMIRPWLLLRPHERSIFMFYACTGTALVILARGATADLARVIESTIAVVWSSMVLAISFLEAWVKFKAPFLRKHVAVDVGRHVFAALNAAELPLAAALWAVRIAAAPSSELGPCGIFVLPVVATLTLIAEFVFIAPRLFLRAKATIVNGFRQQGPKSSCATEGLTDEEIIELDALAEEVEESRPLPSSKWHGVYALFELIKVLSLQSFAFFTLANVKHS